MACTTTVGTGSSAMMARSRASVTGLSRLTSAATAAERTIGESSLVAEVSD